MAQPVLISSGGNITITDQNVIIGGKVPVSISWTKTFSTIYIFNSTSSQIPIGTNVGYVDTVGNFITSIPAGIYLQLSLNSNGQWVQQSSSSTSQTSSGGTVINNGNSGIIGLPIASAIELGAIKVGANLEIDGDGTLNAVNGGQVQSDWAEGDSSQPDYIKNKPTIPAAQVASDWNAVSGVSRILNKPSIPSPYSLPIASASVLGGFKVGSNLSINSGTGVLDATGAGAVSSLTTVGTSGPAALSGGVLNVPNYTSGSAIPTSMPLASSVGILDDGSDQTTALNAVFLSSAIAGIVMDFVNPGAVTISGTVDCQGKMIAFVPGNIFTGAGTLTNGVMSAGYWQKCFDVSVSLTNFRTATDKFSVRWYGAPAGTSDTTYAIQKSIDTVVANQNTMRTVLFPSATYVIIQPLVVYSWTGSTYGQVSIRLEGDSPFWEKSGTGSVIQTSGFRDSFALGIHLGKGVEVKQLKFIGGFTPPSLSSYAFFTCAWADFTDGVSRDTEFSPYSGIVVDPFYAGAPSDGGYPSITSYNGTINFYRGAESNGGSTGIILEDVFITNFVCGFITSPSGFTSDAELIHIFKIQIENCKSGIAGTQDQEKLNKIEHLACWGGTHTLLLIPGIAGQSYGHGRPGNWIIDGINVAGAVNRLIAREGTGFFPMYVKHVYAESLGTVGYWSDSTAGSLEDSIIDFVNLDVFSAYPNYPTNSHFTSTGVTIKGVSFRYYASNLPMIFNGGTFKDCAFEVMPYGTLKMVDCSASGSPINPTDDILNGRASASQYFAGGRGKYTASEDYTQGKQISLLFKDYIASGFLQLDGLANSTSTFTVSANLATVTPPSTDDLSRAIVGRLAFNITTGQLLGIITSVGGSTYNIGYVPDGVVSGSGVIYIWCPAYNFSFMGTTVSGSATITGVVIDFGSYSNLVSHGGGFVKIPSFYGLRSYTQGAKILSYNSGTGVIVMDRPAKQSATNYYFASNAVVKEINVLGINDSGTFPGSSLSNTEIFPKGSRFINDIPPNGRQEFIITDTGYYNSTPLATTVELT